MVQPKIPGTGVGRPQMPYGSDGSDWYALLVDALGRLQVAVAVLAHAASHEDGGGDEIDLTALSGLLADDQHVLDAEVLAVAATLVHKNRHKSGGADELTSADLLEAIVKRIQTSTGPTTLTVGAVADGEYVKRNGSALIGGTPPGADVQLTTAKARAYLSASQEDIADDTWTKILLNVETFDPGSNFDSVTNHRFIAPESGYYLTVVRTRFYNGVIDKSYNTGIFLNDVLYAFWSMDMVHATSEIVVVGSDIIYLAATDYIELWGYHFTGVGTVDIAGGANQTYMSVHILSQA